MATDTQMTEIEDHDHRIQLPGFGKAIDFLPAWNLNDDVWERFPHAIADQLASQGVTVRERRMLAFINQITDKPDWERKVFDETITAKWHEEAVRHHEDIEDLYLSEKMFEFCIAELREKAERFRNTNLIAVMDAEATVVKSDVLVPAGLTKALKDAVQVLENVPDDKKDWHPGSNETCLDLLHPSLYPLIYGTSRVLPNENVPVKGCIAYSGLGETIGGIENQHEERLTHELTLNGWGNTVNLPAWGSYQWLPSDIHFDENGKASIASYVNNLHPDHHAALYPVLEQFVDLAVPMWNEALSYFHNRIRIRVEGTSDEDFYIPEGLKFEGASDHSSDSDFFWENDEYREWKEEVRVLTELEPPKFKPFDEVIKNNPKGARSIDLRQKFADSGLQIIFKLANIQLTPEKSEYQGGSWHVEGALNEHICATALYYYDQENITDSHLSFRQSIDAEVLTMIPQQNEHKSLEMYYGVEQDGPCLQELGQVLTREGRMLAFPNVLQHKVHNFELKDKTKPGHRKILAMFLVDPHIRILSTANVPPQQREWRREWTEQMCQVPQLADLPQEIFDRIIKVEDEFPLTFEKACTIREKLMAERGAMNEELNEGFSNETFFFCEH